MDIKSDQIKLITDSEIIDFCGENPIWDHNKNILYWKDIARGILRSFCPKTNAIKSYPLSDTSGFICSTEKGPLLCGFQKHLSYLHLDDSSVKEEKIEAFSLVGEEHALNRVNDGKCDWQGRLWFGTSGMKNSDAEMFMMGSDLKVTKKDEKLTVFNGPSFSLDNKYFYYADTFKQLIMRCDFNSETGELSNKIEYLKIDQGYPEVQQLTARVTYTGRSFSEVG